MERAQHHGRPYTKLFIALAISFVVMYTVMFLNVDDISHVYFSLTRTYMALLMVTPMAIMMPLLMSTMFRDRRKNIAIIASSVVIFVLALDFLRAQVFVSDQQYMQAMVPHHSSAILTSKHANITDPEVRKLADGIIESQEREIREMKDYLARMR
jgi:uncharacterized protein (DUF305 family)